VKVFFDESGSFNPDSKRTGDPSVLMGAILHEHDMDSLRQDFELYKSQLPSKVIVKGEPKGVHLDVRHCRLLAQILCGHTDIMLVPLTLMPNASDRGFLKELPGQLRDMVRKEARKYLSGTNLSVILEWASRTGNLSSVQLFRLCACAEGAFRATCAIIEARESGGFAGNAKAVRLIFDRVGAPGSREELVFRILAKLWIMMRTQSAAERFGFIGQSFRFEDSRLTWQLQLVDHLASMWRKAVQDAYNTQGYLPLFKDLHKFTIYPPEDPLGMLAFRRGSGLFAAPEQFETFVRIARSVEKYTPCFMKWKEGLAAWPGQDLVGSRA
jgi:hypothetical protein